MITTEPISIASTMSEYHEHAVANVDAHPDVGERREQDGDREEQQRDAGPARNQRERGGRETHSEVARAGDAGRADCTLV